MKTCFLPFHAGHAGQMELVTAAIVPGFEKPSRAEFIKARVESEKLGPIIEPVEHDLAAAKRIHKADYIDFLPTVWPRWTAAGIKGSAMPFTWPTRGLRGDVPPQRIDALLGYYSFDAGATFVEGTWAAIKSSYDVALTAAALVKAGERGRLRALPPARPSRRRAPSWAAIATSTTPPSPRNGSATRARDASPSSTSTIITATARRRSSTSAATFRSSICMATR